MRTYWVVGGALCLLTVLTVALSLLSFERAGAGRGAADVTLALCIATFKASLVALIFMHLKRERGLIYKTLVFTVVFAAALMALSLFAQADPIRIRSGAGQADPTRAAEPSAILEVGVGTS